MKILHNLKAKLFSAIVIGATLASAPVSAGAYSEEVAEKVGPFVIHRIFDDGNFNRCAATLQQGKNFLRVAQRYDGVYSISVPGVRKSKKLVMDFHDMESFSYPANTDGNRTWAAWDNFGVETLKNAQESINISVGGRDFSWNIGKTSMRRVMAAVEDCVQNSR